MQLNKITYESAGASNGSTYVSCRRKWIFKREESRTSDYGSFSSNSTSNQGGESTGSYGDVIDNPDRGWSGGSYADVYDVRSTHLEFQAICHSCDSSNDADGYLEVCQVINSGRDGSDGYLHAQPRVGSKYVSEDEISLTFNENGDLLDMHGYLKLFDDEPRSPIKTRKPQVLPPTKKLVKCIPKEKFKTMKTIHGKMKLCITALAGLVLATLCVFLLTWFGILNPKVSDCIPPSTPPPCFNFPWKYNLLMGENATIRYVLPTLPNRFTIYVDLHRTRVRNQDERLLQVDNVNKSNTLGIESRRVSATFSEYDGLISITIKIQGTQCHDHGYISINDSGVLLVNLKLDVTAPVTPCPLTAEFKWNTTEFINCSACVGNAAWNVTWYREVNGIYVPVPENNDPNVLTPLSLTNGLEERIVSVVDFAFGVIIFKLVNRRVFCSDGGIYKVSFLPEGIEQNVTINITVHGFLESCPPVWEIKLIDRIRKTCSLCIGEAKDVANLTITQTVPVTSKLASTQLVEGESNETSISDFLTIETNVVSGLLNVLFKWSRVQCMDEGSYQILAVNKGGRMHRNISIYIDELAFLTPPAIIQESGDRGGFVEGFNLSLTCSATNIGCKKRDIYLSPPKSNTTSECKDISLRNDNINDSYRCLLTWTEINISRDLNGTTFYCGYNYTHYNGTEIKFQSELLIFAIPGSICINLAPRCKTSHPLGGRFFIECDTLFPNRPWEMMCAEKLVFKPGSIKCDGKCDYP